MRRIFGVDSADFYAMADLNIARKIGGGLWLGGATIALSGCMEVQFPSDGLGFRNFGMGLQPVDQLGPGSEPFRVPPVDMSMIPREFHRQYVAYSGKYEPGTIIVDTAHRHLYLVTARDRASG